jgi:hypothetical protein
MYGIRLFSTSGIIHVEAPWFRWHHCLYLVKFITCKRILLYSHSPLGRATRYVLHLTWPDYSSSFSLVLCSQPTALISSNSRCSTSRGNKRYLGLRCSTSWVTSVSSLSTNVLGLGREAKNLSMANKKLNMSIESSISKWTARMVEHLMTNNQRLTVARPILV